MKICETIINNFQSIGIEFVANRVSFGPYEWNHVLAYMVSTILISIHLVFVAETSREYIKSIFMIAVGILLLTTYSSFRFHSIKIRKIIDELQFTVDKSE